MGYKSEREREIERKLGIVLASPADLALYLHMSAWGPQEDTRKEMECEHFDCRMGAVVEFPQGGGWTIPYPEERHKLHRTCQLFELGRVEETGARIRVYRN